MNLRRGVGIRIDIDLPQSMHKGMRVSAEQSLNLYT